jgi:hypothetical protein
MKYIKVARSWLDKLRLCRTNILSRCDASTVCPATAILTRTCFYTFDNNLNSGLLGFLYFVYSEAPCYKSEGSGFDSGWGHWIFFGWPNPSSHTIAQGSTQPLTEMSTRNLPGEGKGGRRIRLTLPPSVSRLSKTVGASISHNPMGPHGLLQG